VQYLCYPRSCKAAFNKVYLKVIATTTVPLNRNGKETMNAKPEDLPFTRFIHGFRAKSMECKRLVAYNRLYFYVTLIVDAGLELQDTGYRIQVIGFKIPVTSNLYTVTNNP